MKLLTAATLGLVWSLVALGLFWVLALGVQLVVQLVQAAPQYVVAFGLVWFTLTACSLMVTD